MDIENKLILYKDENGKVSVNVRFADEDVWLTQAQLAAVYGYDITKYKPACGKHT